jgi:O-antigen ligase
MELGGPRGSCRAGSAGFDSVLPDPHPSHHAIPEEPLAPGHSILSGALEKNVPGTISLNPYATWSECLKMLAYAGVFWLAVVYGRDRKRVRASLWILGTAGCLYAVYGLAAFLTELGSTLWFHKMPHPYAGVSGTFINRNMYVDSAAFGLLAVVCLILGCWSSGSGSGANKHGIWRDLVAGKDSHVLLLCAMGLILLASLTMTGSRGGVLASMIAVGALLFLSFRRVGISKTTRKQSLVIGLVLVGLVALVYALAGSHLGFRFVETTADTGAGRLAGYQMLLRAIGEAPFTGFGAGNSLDVFYLYNDESMWKAFNYAHNIYLGAAVELGLPAAAALIAAVGLVAFHCLRGVSRRSRDQTFPALGVGVTLLVAIHGLFDSPLYLSANAATFSFLLGLAYAQSWPTRSFKSSLRAEDSLGQTDRSLQEPSEAQIE